ncbi:MAG: D-2-hydroxyacid dehydrogenase [Planctomycetota bacterium]
MLPKIVTCFPLTEQQLGSIRDSGHGKVEVVGSDQDRIAEDLMHADIFCGHAKVPVDWPAVVQQGRLKWIQSSAAGLDHCLVPEVIDSEIVVTGCSCLFAPQVAEQTVALLMGLVRRLHVFFHAQNAKQFVRRPTDNLEDKKVLIVGFGGNGQQIARVLRPMVNSISATDCFADNQHLLLKDGTIDCLESSEDLDQLLPNSDVIIVTLPKSAANEQLFESDKFRLMKPGAYLINVGRGSVVDTSAMIDSLTTGHLGGVGIDVVNPEPLPVGSPLWEMDNVIISPHVGAQSPRRVPRTVELFIENMNRYLQGKKLLNLVDKQLGFPKPADRIDHSENGWAPS